ncbi:MAG: hypothetical protein LBR53_01075 [Deltaproteobacteria bacterium]|jgi:hypothetical protein|nr:hypothetical protein [Deltaproteobacteria bacterium]
MAMQKPLISVCIDGKPHSWMVVAEEAMNNGDDIVKLEHRWCKKCGCLTQVGITTAGEPVVAVSDNGAPHLAVPRILDIIIK